jgi:hypothetical protein
VLTHLETSTDERVTSNRPVHTSRPVGAEKPSRTEQI